MKPIKTIEQLREYCRAYRLIHECSIEDEPEVEEEEELETAAPRRRTREPNHAAAAKKYADDEPLASGCLSGSGKETSPGANFAPGGHKRLAAIAGAVNAGLLAFDRVPTHAYEYLLASDEYPDLSELIRNAQPED